MGSQIDISSYIAATGIASKRSRIVYLAIAAFSALVISGMLNSSPNASRQRQFQLAQDVLRWHDDLVDGKPPEFTAGTTAAENKKANFDKAKEFFDRHQSLLGDKSRAEKVLLPLISEGIFSRQVVKLPLLGISLDSRDLSPLSGIAFCILLLIFRFSLYREQENLKISFAAAREQGVSRQCYNLMQMKQVLFIPKSNWIQSQRTTPAQKHITEPKSARWLATAWNFLPLVVFPLPIFLQLVILGDTLRGLRAGPSPPEELTIYTGNVVLLLLIFSLTYSCFNMSRRMDEHWKDQRDFIDNSETTTEKTIGGKWSYEANDNQGVYKGTANFSTGESGHMEIEGIREWHRPVSGKIVDKHVRWHSDRVLISNGRIMFEFYVDEPGEKSSRVWCVLQKTQDGMKGQNIHLSAGKRFGEVHFFREA